MTDISAWLQSLHQQDPRPTNGVPVNDGDPLPDGYVIGSSGMNMDEAVFGDVKRRYEAQQRLRRELLERQFDGELSQAAEGYRDRLAASLKTSAELDDIPDPDPLIEGWMILDSLTWIAGPSGSYKSFIALDIAARFGSPHMDYHGQEMSHGKALYFIAEGATMFKHRKNAWQKKNDAVMEGVDFVPAALQLSDVDVAVPALIDLAKDRGYKLIIFDTQAMCTVGSEESDNTDMGVVVNALHALRDATGACVLLVHHFGKDASGGMRGASNMYAAANTVITTKRKGDVISLSTVSPLGKQKDGEERSDMHFDMAYEPTTGGHGSLVPVRDTAYRSAPILPEVTERELAILRALVDAETIGLSTTDIARVVEDAEPKRLTVSTGSEKWAGNNAKSWMDKLLKNATAVKVGATYFPADIAAEIIADAAESEE